ncbi:MAG: hypothetical protein IPH07_09810 [Deltaproteobacteria bacterium]|nr:hypothetical protein [Deltaproteobacteria bacterium]MBP7286440.1 hypothetical protein [Nannocystaceae bacterium]
MVRALATTIGFGIGLAAAPACKPVTWQCRHDYECTIEDVQPGVCEPDGWCSFTNTRCPSGRWYGDLAGDGLARTCVAETPGSSSSSSSSSSSGSSSDGSSSSS